MPSPPVVVVAMTLFAAVEQLDGDAVDAGLAGVLDAVAVGVVPDPVADRAGAAVAEVDVGAVWPAARVKVAVLAVATPSRS